MKSKQAEIQEVLTKGIITTAEDGILPYSPANPRTKASFIRTITIFGNELCKFLPSLSGMCGGACVPLWKLSIQLHRLSKHEKDRLVDQKEKPHPTLQ